MPRTPTNSPALSPQEAVQRVARARHVLFQEVHKAVVGHDELIELMLIAALAGGHCLIVGAAGLAKSLSAAVVARALNLKFNRISFTPDLTPSDIVGTEIGAEDGDPKHQLLRFVRGPIFANVVLADELNRAPAKTQATLLQAMQQQQVMSGGDPYDLEPPFLVVATQNSNEGDTATLTAAQLDRFMLSSFIDYPSKDEERQIVRASIQEPVAEIRPVLRARDVLWIQRLVRSIPVSEGLVEYAVDLVRSTRPTEPHAAEFVKKWVTAGAGPRAAGHLIVGAKARALLKGRTAVHAADVRALAKPVLRHRIIVNPEAILENLDADEVILRLLQTIAEPATGADTHPPTLIVVDEQTHALPQNPSLPNQFAVNPIQQPELPPEADSSYWPPDQDSNGQPPH